MTELNSEMRELAINELDEVSGGSWFGSLLTLAGMDSQGKILDKGIQIDANHRVGPIRIGK